MTDESEEGMTISQWVEVIEIVARLFEILVIGVVALYFNRRWEKETETQMKFGRDSIEDIYVKVMDPLNALIYTTASEKDIETMYVARRHCDKLRCETLRQQNPTLPPVQWESGKPDLYKEYLEDSDLKSWENYNECFHELMKYRIVHTGRVNAVFGYRMANKYEMICHTLTAMKMSLWNTYHNVKDKNNYNMASNFYEEEMSVANVTAQRRKNDFMDRQRKVAEDMANMDTDMLQMMQIYTPTHNNESKSKRTSEQDNNPTNFYRAMDGMVS